MSKHIFVYICVFILTLFGFSFFAMIKTNYNKPVYNFSPFPTVKPPNIPAPTSSTDMPCKSNILSCKNYADCTARCGQDYECTPVSAGENVIINGTKVQPGTWCLPKGKRELGCGTYTGRAIWSDIDGQQQWTCSCLYPDLFGGKSCLDQFACRDGTDDQTNNVLIDMYGNKWDPNDLEFNPKNTTPYDRNADGSPRYFCSCNQNKGEAGKVKYTRLPGDPYRCHLDPCTTNHMFSAFSGLKCDCPSISPGMYAHSNVDGQCHNTSNVCTWNDDGNECSCSGGATVPVNCNSNTMQRGDAYPACVDPTNPGGSYCGSPCQNYCDNGATCTVVGQKPMCDCSSISGGNTQYSGNRCEKSCLKDGTNVAPGPEYYHLCCSGWSSTSIYDPFGPTKCAHPS